MGYFSNGTEGDMYHSQYCADCAHDGDCAVWEAHLMHNYDECNNEKSLLHYFIPRGDTGFNEKCRMWMLMADIDGG